MTLYNAAAGRAELIAAADPRLLPVGSVIQIYKLGERYNGIYTIMDTGPAVQGRILDIYMWSCHEALELGRRPMQLTVLRLGWNPKDSTPSPIEAQVRAAYTTSFNANPANFVVHPNDFHVLGGYTFANEDNRNVWKADRSNFQPRIGASYQVTDKTVVRAGFGIFMAPFQIETPQQVGFAGSTPFVAVVTMADSGSSTLFQENVACTLGVVSPALWVLLEMVSVLRSVRLLT